MAVDPEDFIKRLNASWDGDDVPNQVAAFFAEDAILWDTGDTSPGAGARRGRAEIAEGVRVNRLPFPDFRETFNFVAQEGRRVVVEWIATGTHTGAAYQGIPPTGRRIEFPGLNVFELDDDGLIRIERPFWD